MLPNSNTDKRTSQKLPGNKKVIKPAIGWIITTLIALIPCIYLLYLEQPQFAADFNYIMRLIGRLTALFGVSLFSLTFLLNTRIKFLEDVFGGFDKTYKAHRTFGTAAFVSLLFHPMFLASTYLSISVTAAARFFIPANNFSVVLGTLSLLAMEIFLIFTFFAKAKYQHWKSVHRLLGIAFLLGGLHTLLVAGDVRNYAFIRWYTILMVSIGSLSFIYRTLLWESLVKRYTYIIGAVKMLGSSIVELTLVPEKESMLFLPGQFIFISLVSGIANSEPHPFTISSAASDKTIRLSVKSLGDFTSDLKNVTSGTKVKLEGPYGRFCPVSYSKKDQVWIAGGIGVTPFLSMARSMDSHRYADAQPCAETTKKAILFDELKACVTGDVGTMSALKINTPPKRGNIDMYYCASDAKDAIFLDELNAISSKNKNFRVIPFFSSKQGRLNANHVLIESKGLENKEIFICGPPAMMRALKSQFAIMGIPGTSIHMEEFEL